MNKQTTRSNRGAQLRFIKTTFMAGLLPALVLISSLQSTHAGSATWNLNPTSDDWNTAANWTPATVPNSVTDTATFGLSNTTDISISTFINVAGIVFNAGASAYTLESSGGITFNGSGMINNSGEVQTVSLSLGVGFENSSTAGDMIVYSGPVFFGGTSNAGTSSFSMTGFSSVFAESSTASAANFTVPEDSLLQFQSFSNAGTATLNVQPSANAVDTGGAILFRDSSSAANANFTAEGSVVANPNGRALVDFDNTSGAGNATIIALSGSNGGEGGHIAFDSTSIGGTPRVELFGNGQLDISGHDAPGTSVGSIEGDGLVFLGANSLTVGANNLITAFSGVIQDGGVGGGVGGSLTKIGTGRLALSGANTYTGGTTLSGGTLLVTNRSGSATGTGPVSVRAGTLGGTGKILSAVSIGRNTSVATLAPGAPSRTGRLTLQSGLTFAARGKYKVDLNSSTATADQVVAKGVRITTGATVTVTDQGNTGLTAGTVFTIINNTATTPVSGTFANLADGSTLLVGGNTYLASYEGGTGNDLTLTVQ